SLQPRSLPSEDHEDDVENPSESASLQGGDEIDSDTDTGTTGRPYELLLSRDRDAEDADGLALNRSSRDMFELEVLGFNPAHHYNTSLGTLSQQFIQQLHLGDNDNGASTR
ncbi:unnamed protein product, partial [Amoebophrya sp. A120]